MERPKLRARGVFGKGNRQLRVNWKRVKAIRTVVKCLSLWRRNDRSLEEKYRGRHVDKSENDSIEIDRRFISCHFDATWIRICVYIDIFYFNLQNDLFSNCSQTLVILTIHLSLSLLNCDRYTFSKSIVLRRICTYSYTRNGSVKWKDWINY